MSFEEKIFEASKLGLDEAIEEMVFNAVKSGQWAYMINRGFQPGDMFSSETYYGPICRAVLSVKKLSLNWPQI